MIKGSYKVDLSALHALCEANYARLLRLFPDYESCNTREFSVAAARVHIAVIERSRYTTLFRLSCFRASVDVQGGASAASEAGDKPGWLAPLKLEARAYHDAGMLEVVAFYNGKHSGKNGGRQIQGRYSYPNPAMHQQDEKRQQNAFLADWLSHCLHHGEADMAGFLQPGTEHA